MPELPEVETIKKDLEIKLKGQRLKNIKEFNKLFIYKNNLKNLDTLLGKRLDFIERKGKYLIFFFEKELLIFHLRLTGFFLLYKKEDKTFDKNQKYLILSLEFENYILSYFDIRKFGKIMKIKTEEMSDFKEFKKLGKDALEISLDEFKQIFYNKKRNIKNLLMDQRVISGLGNIYVNELLFRAQINPFKRCKDLQEEEIKRLFFQMKNLLKSAIDLKGSSIKNYVSTEGERGEFQRTFFVYGRKDLPCLKCGTKLKYKKIAQRGTFYCPKCQGV